MVLAATKTSNAANGRIRGGLGYVDQNPPVVEPPSTLVRGLAKVKAFAYTAPTVTNGRVLLEPVWAEVKAHRDRIIVGGKDVTYFRDVVTPMPGYPLTQPHGYGAMTLVFPQTHAVFEKPGKGALSWLAKEKRVRIQRVDVDTGERHPDYFGVITRMRMEKVDDKLCWAADVGGALSGRAALRDRQVPLFHVNQDIGRRVFDAVGVMNLRFTPRFGPVTGMRIAGFGGMSHLDYLNQLCAMAVRKNGDHYTLMPTAADPSTFEFRLKDTTTRHATVYFDSGNIVPDLVDDLAEQPTDVYGSGVTPGGMRIKGGIYPGLRQGTAGPYPIAAGAPFGVGTTDADTINGDGIQVMAWKLIGTGYLDREEFSSTYTDEMADAVESLQADADLPQTGTMNTATWDALFDVNVTGYTLRASKVMPMAQKNYTRLWIRSSDGSRIKKNPGYRRDRLPVHRTLAFGSGHTVQDMHRFSRREITRASGQNWVGTIEVNTGAVIRGEHTPGDPLTPADVMPLRELRPGMNLWAPLFDGGTLLHIAGITINPGGTTGTLTVDTQYRDLLSVTEIIQRNRDSRDNPARAFLEQHRSSKQAKDGVGPFDEVGGLVFNAVYCPANQWTVFPVVAGQEGSIRKIRVQTSDVPAAYSLSIWAKDPGEENLNAKIPTPLAIDPADRSVVWGRGLDVFDNKVLLGAWGDEEQPCGYAPRQHTNDRGDVTSAPVTGLFVDEGGFSYHMLKYPVLYVAIWPTSATTIKPQRIMWPQLEAGS